MPDAMLPSIGIKLMTSVRVFALLSCYCRCSITARQLASWDNTSRPRVDLAPAVADENNMYLALEQWKTHTYTMPLTLGATFEDEPFVHVRLHPQDDGDGKRVYVACVV